MKNQEKFSFKNVGPGLRLSAIGRRDAVWLKHCIFVKYIQKPFFKALLFILERLQELAIIARFHPVSSLYVQFQHYKLILVYR